MPSSPAGLALDQYKRVLFSDSNKVTPNVAANSSNSKTKQPKQVKFHSQPIPAGAAYAKVVSEGRISYSSEQQHRNSRNDRLKDKCYNSFKTLSGKLERQLSFLRGKQQELEPDLNDSQSAEVEALPVDRYFDALEGPELETLRVCDSFSCLWII